MQQRQSALVHGYPGYVQVFLRRGLGGSGPLLRIEYVGQPALPMGMVYGPAMQPVPPAVGAQEPPPCALAPEEPTGDLFELGPTYEEELQMREAQARQQEDAVLQHLLQQNLKLQSAIGAEVAS